MNDQERKEEMRYRVAHHKHLTNEVFNAPTDTRWRHWNRLGMDVLMGSSDGKEMPHEFDVEYVEEEMTVWHPFTLIDRAHRGARLGDLEMLRKEFATNVADEIVTSAMALLSSMTEWTFYRAVPQNQKETSYEFFFDLKGVAISGETVAILIALREEQDRWFIEDVQARK